MPFYFNLEYHYYRLFVKMSIFGGEWVVNCKFIERYNCF